ncbi:MAG: diaminopimelate epimerase [Candidatus Omnitrophica bacterium]|nr:diaminopimelate epimerase [Candidatus Omnitrophota bacterium]
MFKTVQRPFLQYSATGNTFVLLDNRQEPVAAPEAAAKELCAKLSVDGLLLMESSEAADVRMRILNPDGSEASMCGNGSRAAAHWAHHEMKLPVEFKIDTLAGVLNARVADDIAKIRLTDPKDFGLVEGFEVPGALPGIYFVNTGVPHLVTELKGLETANVHELGKTIRYHERFKPAGTNASFFEVLEPGLIRVRVYERGVEGETLSCGTGSSACGIVAAHKHGYASPVRVRVQSGDELNIYFEKTTTGFKNVDLEGAVKCLKKGVIAI